MSNILCLRFVVPTTQVMDWVANDMCMPALPVVGPTCAMINVGV